jgi:hypothetical protein
VTATLQILAEIAGSAYRIRVDTSAEEARRQRISRWKRRAPRLVFVAAVALIAFLIRRR